MFRFQVKDGPSIMLGGTFVVLMALRNLTEVAGSGARARYPTLRGLAAVLGTTVSAEWVARLRGEARDYLSVHGADVTSHTRSMLERLVMEAETVVA